MTRAVRRAWGNGVPPDRPQAEAVHGDPGPVERADLAELVQQHRLQPLEHPSVGPLGKPPPAGRHRAAAELAHRQQRPRVEVRHMKMIAAMQARSDTVRGAPPRACEGVGGSSGWMRCHSASGSSLVGQSGHERGSSHTTHPTQPQHLTRRGSGMSAKRGTRGFVPDPAEGHGRVVLWPLMLGS
jgi:hypothetical protein